MPRTRPVVSGNQGKNVHLNNMLSEMIEPIATLAKDSAKVISSEDSLRIIDNFNNNVTKESKQMDTFTEEQTLCECGQECGDSNDIVNQNEKEIPVGLVGRGKPKKITIQSWLRSAKQVELITNNKDDTS